MASPRLRAALLVEKTVGPGGEKSWTWRTTTFTTKKGAEITGRYEGNEEGIVVQVGHRDAFASGAREVFMLEDADLNQASGNVVESKGALSFKEAVIVDGAVIELQSLKLWESHVPALAGASAGAKSFRVYVTK